MTIKNLSQLKRAINENASFTIVKHYMHPEFDGQIRTPNVKQTNGFYSVIKDNPDHFVSKANYGKGYWLTYGKAGEWEFVDGICRHFINRMRNGNAERIPVFEIKF
jgi:hypothetical protein